MSVPGMGALLKSQRFRPDVVPCNSRMLQDKLTPEFLKEAEKQNQKENKALLKAILSIPETDFDRIFHPLAQTATERIDCTLCGNCCKNLNPPVLPEEVNRLAAKLKMNAGEFSDEFLLQPENRPYFILRKSPCTFLDHTRCSIYSDRPASCADYPHLLSPGQKYRLALTIAQYPVCPIVYLTLEALKEQLSE